MIAPFTDEERVMIAIYASKSYGDRRAATSASEQGYASLVRLSGTVVWIVFFLAFLTLMGCDKPDTQFIRSTARATITFGNPIGAQNVIPIDLAKSADLKTKAIDPSITLGIYTPTAAFYGNQMAVVGGATGTASNPSGAILVREANCSLTQYGISYGTTGVYGTASSVVASLPNADAYLHQISGLKSTAGTFPKGCSNRTLGVPSAPYAHLGKASDGNFVAVYVDDSGKMISLKVSSSGAVISQITLVSSGAASTVAVADFNGDGIADIVSPFLTVGANSGIGVFLSQANGTFAAPALFGTYPAGVSRFNARASIDDINADGKVDIVAMGGPISNTSFPTVITLLGNGSGGFASGTTAVKSILVTQFVLADFNGDGKLDILNAGGEWTPGLGDGSFGTPQQRFSNPQLVDGRNLAVGDFNGDGKLDVMVRSGQISLSVFLGQGDGSFVAGASYAAVRGADFLTSSDVNGDGFADIVVGLSSATAFGANGDSQTLIQFLLGKGDGTFLAAQSFPGVGGTSLNAGTPTFALADFNGDGYPDLVAPPPGGGAALGLYLGSSTGAFASPSGIASLGFNPSMMISADTDGDGKADVIALGSSLAVLRSLGSASAGPSSFAPAKIYALPAVTGSVKNLAVGDVNGDGRADVLVILGGQSATSGGAYLYLANADGTLKTPVQIDAAVNIRSVAMGDLNSDGRSDIALGSASSQFYTSSSLLKGVRVYRGNADGTVTATVTVNPDDQYVALAIGDVNKDGKADLILASQSSGLNDSLMTLPGLGDGTFGTAINLALADGGPGVTSIALGDFTFDGNVDVMLTGSYTEVIVGQGNGTFFESSAISIASRSKYVVAADLNKDTMVDAVVLGADGLVPLLRVNSAVATKAVVTPTANNEFGISLGSTSGTVSSGQSAQTSMTLNFGSAFTQAVTFSCSGLPAYATCGFSPATLAPGAGATTTTVTINTGVPTSVALAAAGLGLVLFGGLGIGGLDQRGAPGVSLRPSVLLIRRVSSSLAERSIPVRWLFASLFACLLFAVLAACGGGSGSASAVSSTATPAGTYPVTITATGGGVSKSLNYSLTVQ
jgi:FG-GAP-like repeat